MKTHIEIGSLRNVAGSVLAGIFVLCFFAFAISGQAPPNPAPPPEAVATGALVIPMDNVNQGNGAGTTFNLRAYGLVNLLLQNNVPVKWAIKPDKSKDAVDFSATVTRIAGAAGVAGPSSVSFSGGPFIVAQEYDTPSVRNLITTYNSGGTAVTVYKTTAPTTAEIRYMLTHKPKIAIGPDSGNFGAFVHQALFDTAGIGSAYYTIVDNSIINANSCFTLATQAHSTDPQFVNLYRQFGVSGGNLVLQCASVGTYENNVNGHFQTTNPGYTVWGTGPPDISVNTLLAYPDGAMPFNQFIGVLANQDGAITEYAYAPGGGPFNGNLVSVTNTAPHAEKFVATVSQLNGPATAGGVVFELGGHDYSRTISGASEIERLNGQRMVLNAVFVPVTRPAACGLEQANVTGFKSVRRFNFRDGGFALIAGDTLEWTIDYINNSLVDVNNFQIQDIIQANLTYVAGSAAVTLVSGVGTSATANASYNGAGNANLLAPLAFLPVGGRIQVKIRTLINLGTPTDTILANQTGATGSTLVSVTNSDNIDWTNLGIFGPGPDGQPPADSILQPQNPASIDPTIARIKAGPSAAAGSIEGSVRTPNGSGIARAVVTVVNAATGASNAVRTNSFGSYRVEGLEIGQLYIVSVNHKQYHFSNGTVTFTLNDSITGLAFVGNGGASRSEDAPVKGKK